MDIIMQKAVERWVKQGTPHEPLSEHIYEIISELDFALGDSFAFKSGGDGDNGEQLMYLLDAYFRRRYLQDKPFNPRFP